MYNSRPHLRFDVVPNDGKILVRKSSRPLWIAGDEDGNVIDEPEAGLERATGVKAGRLFRADGEIIDHYFSGGILQFGDDLFACGFLFQREECAQRVLVAHMRRVAIKNAAHLHDGAGELDFLTKGFCAIGRRENCFADVEADFTAIDVKSSDNLDIARPVKTDLPVHQPDGRAVGGGAAIKIDSLDKRAGAVSNADDGNSYFSHF